MKARYALLSLILILPACGAFRDRRPLSGIGSERGPLVLDAPEPPPHSTDGREPAHTTSRQNPAN